jgi:uncharacterized membrane protein required for colicin V production
VILVWLVVFSIHGLLRGTVAQVFSALGLFAGLWAGLWVSHWLDAAWRGAQPYLVFLVLRWIVAVLAGTVVATIFQWCGDSLGRFVQSGPIGWLDRGGGVGVGVVLGLVTLSMAMMAGLLVREPRALSRSVASAHTAEPMMATAAEASERTARWLPGGRWWAEHFRMAHRRTLTAGVEARAKS